MLVYFLLVFFFLIQIDWFINFLSMNKIQYVYVDICEYLLVIGESFSLCFGFNGMGFSQLFMIVGIFKGLFYYYFCLKEVFGEVMLQCYFDCYDVQMVILLIGL